jgi:DNA repair exonuclease SbcCD ATPase subunit
LRLNQDLLSVERLKETVDVDIRTNEQEEKNLIKREMELVRRREEFRHRDEREAETHSRLTSLLRRHGIEPTKPFSVDTEIRLKAKQNEHDADRRRVQADAAALQNRVSLFRDHDWVLVNQDIETLAVALRGAGLSVLPGAEYLDQRPDEESRARTLAGSPLLPYGLVIERSELEKLGKEAIPDIPVYAGIPLLFRENVLEADPKGPGHISEIGVGAVILEHSNRDLFLKKEVREERRRDDRQQLDGLLQDAERLEHSVSDVRQAVRELREYLDTNPGERILALEEESREIGKEEKAVSALRSDIQAKRQTLANTDVTLIQKRELLRTQVSDQRNRLISIQASIELEQVLDKLAKERETAEAKKKEISAEAATLNNTISSARTRRDHLRDQQTEADSALTRLSERLSGLRIPDGWTNPATASHLQHEQNRHDRIIPPQTAADLENLRASLKERLSGFSRSRDDLVESMKRAEADLARYRKELEQKAFTEEEAATFSPLPVHLFEEQTRQKGQAEKELIEKSHALEQLGKTIAADEGGIREKEHRLEQEFHLPAATDFPGSIDQEETSLRLQEERFRHLLQVATSDRTNNHQLNDQFKQAGGELDHFFENLTVPFSNVRGDPSLAELPAETTDGNIRDRSKHLCITCRGSIEEYHNARSRSESRLQELRIAFTGTTFEALRLFIESLPGTESEMDVWDDPVRIRSVFEPRFEMIHRLRQDTELQLENARKDRGELAHSCLTLARRVLEELENIDQKSMATIGGKSVKMIEISIEPPEKEIMLQRLVGYLDQIANELKDQVLGDQEIQKTLQHRLQARCILHEACNLDQAKIRVRKPARPPQKPRYANWEEVPRFSGGEKYVCYFALYLSLMTYLRSRRTPGNRSKKVILADNPFGRMSADFLLEAVFTLTRHTDTQMICFTALKESSILQHFPRVFSMVLRQNSDGKEIMTTNAAISSMETARVIVPIQQLLF